MVRSLDDELDGHFSRANAEADIESRSRKVAEYVEHVKETAGQSLVSRRREGGDPEAWDVAALLQGMLAGSVMHNQLLAIQNVELPVDDEGNYLDHFIAVTRAGFRIRVTIAPE